VGVAPGYFSVESAIALLLSFTALDVEHSNVTGLGRRPLVGLSPQYPDPSRSLLARRSLAEAESALRSLRSFAFCSTEAESVMRSLPSLALARREHRVLDLSELCDTFSFGLACGILVCGKQ
jgi:hypothetical protein